MQIKPIAINLLLLISLACAPVALASTMSNSSYQLDINSDAPTPFPKPTIAPEKKVEVSNKNVRIINGDNFTAYLSYEDDTQHLPFIIESSTPVLNFGKIVPGEPLIRTQSITVLPGSARGYDVIGYENHSPQAGSSLIPDTTCDTGNCTNILADTWTIPLTYGFGYRCDDVKGQICDAGFKKDLYKRFSNEALSENPVSILSSAEPINSESIISYKINTSATQADKAYQNIIYDIAVPHL